MTTTSPDNIRTPDPGDAYNLVADLAVTASDVQNALSKRANLYKGTGAQRTAFTTAPNGTYWQDTDGGGYLWVRKSGAWMGALPLAGGPISLSSTGGSPATSAVVFPSGYFGAPPIVTVGYQAGQNASVTINAGPSDITTGGFTLNMSRSTTTNTILYWTATPAT